MNTENTSTQKVTGEVIAHEDLRKHWLGHRDLTRRVIAAFPEKEFFNFSIGGMRTFSAIVEELLAIGAPGMREIVKGESKELDEKSGKEGSLAEVLERWDAATAEIDQLWSELPSSRFSEKITTFGKYPGTIRSSILYFIDNEIHHRGQGYVYLRALGVTPPFFWER